MKAPHFEENDSLASVRELETLGPSAFSLKNKPARQEQKRGQGRGFRSLVLRRLVYLKLQGVHTPRLAWPPLEDISPTLFTTDDGEGAGAQGHFVKAEIEILARNACMGIYKSSGYNPQRRLPRPIKAGPTVAWMESYCMSALASTSAILP